MEAAAEVEKTRGLRVVRGTLFPGSGQFLREKEVKVPTLSHRTRQGWGTRFFATPFLKFREGSGRIGFRVLPVLWCTVSELFRDASG
jgi:hypothetical protein